MTERPSTGNRRPRTTAAKLARSFADLLGPLVEIESDDLQAGLSLFERHEQLGAFDAVLAAAALNREAEALISADSAFAVVPKLPFVSLDSPDLAVLLA